MHQGKSPQESIIVELGRVVETVPAQDIPTMIGDLERLKAMLLARLLQPQVTATPKVAPKLDRLLTPEQAAEILGVKPRWIRDHWREIPGSQRLSGRCLRFSEARLRRWIAQGGP